jgi:predicted dehydrogenase
MAAKKIRLGFVGCGFYMRYYHLANLRDNPGVELLAAADTDATGAEQLRQQHGQPVRVYADYRQMIRREPLDAVIIGTPHVMHYEQTRFALQHGLHALVQKPLTIRAVDAEKLVRLAHKQKRFLGVSYQRFYHAPYVRARQLVRHGALGEIRGVAYYITQDWQGRGWRCDPRMSGGGMLMDTGSHVLSSILHVTGRRPAKVSAWMDFRAPGVDVNTLASIRLDNGAPAAVTLLGTTKKHDERFSVHGSKGCIVLHMYGWRVKSALFNDEPMRIPARIRDRTPDAVFYGWIRSGGKGYQPPRLAVDTIRLTEAIYRCAALGRPVKLRPAP